MASFFENAGAAFGHAAALAALGVKVKLSKLGGGRKWVVEMTCSAQPTISPKSSTSNPAETTGTSAGPTPPDGQPRLKCRPSKFTNVGQPDGCSIASLGTSPNAWSRPDAELAELRAQTDWKPGHVLMADRGPMLAQAAAAGVLGFSDTDRARLAAARAANLAIGAMIEAAR